MNFEFSLGFATRTMSRFLHRISNNICDFATGEGNDRPRSSLVFATRSTFVFLASFLHTNFSLHSIASETLNQFRLSTQSNVEGFNCCRYTKLSDDCAFNAWQKTTTHSWQERGLRRCPTLKPCQGCRIKEYITCVLILFSSRLVFWQNFCTLLSVASEEAC